MTLIMDQEFTVQKDDFANAGKVSSSIRRQLKILGVRADVIRRIGVASYESEINMIIHAYGGVVRLEVEDDGYIRIIFKDDGPGIPDLEKAMTPGWSTASEQAREMGFGAGMGLPNIKRVSDDFDIVTAPEGTTITLGFREGE